MGGIHSLRRLVEGGYRKEEDACLDDSGGGE